MGEGWSSLGPHYIRHWSNSSWATTGPLRLRLKRSTTLTRVARTIFWYAAHSFERSYCSRARFSGRRRAHFENVLERFRRTAREEPSTCSIRHNMVQNVAEHSIFPVLSMCSIYLHLMRFYACAKRAKTYFLPAAHAQKRLKRKISLYQNENSVGQSFIFTARLFYTAFTSASKITLSVCTWPKIF